MSAARAMKTRSTTRSVPSRPVLRVIDHRQQRSLRLRRQVMFGIFIFVLAGFFAVATAHAELVSNQRDLDVLRQDIAAASASNAVLERQVVEASSPEEIVRRAQDLGMVRAEEPVYLIASGPVREPATPVLMQPPPPEQQVVVAAPGAEPSVIAGSRAVSVGLEVE